ncbi:hypothetical protein [Streptomyces sp. cmx-4-9]|uniref:hypothetical protein n=1 Tax=Streptomyces sp. cmx-4-9 TaxID=2790941 RepID=UPI0039816C5E
MSEQQPFRHNLRFENHGADPDPQHGADPSPSGRATTGATTVTCTCGLDTGALPSDDARLMYEVHRNEIRDQVRGWMPPSAAADGHQD